MKNKYLLAFFISIYSFLIIGLILHTSTGKEQVFGKYSWGYFSLILFFIIFAFISYKLINYLYGFRMVKIYNKKIKLNSRRKILTAFVLFLVILFCTELYLRQNDIKPQKTAYDMEFHPFLQKKLRSNLNYEFHTNSFGFRSKEITKEKAENIYRIIILGGSTAYGDGVSYEQNSAKLLEDLLNNKYNKKTEVINAAVSGYTSQHSLIDYMSRISEFDPDLVIMWHGVNDMYAYCRDISSPNIAYRSDYSHLLGPLGNMVNTYFNPPLLSINFYTIDVLFDFIKSHLYSDLRPGIEQLRYSFVNAEREKYSIKDFKFESILSYERNLEYFINIVKSDNADIILGNQPNMFSTSRKHQLSKDGLYCFDGYNRASLKSQIEWIGKFNAITKKVAIENDVYFIDLDSYIPRTPQYFLDEIHWSEKGHKIIARRLYDYVIKRKFIKDL